MDNNVKVKYINKINSFKGVSYLMGIIAFCAAPTIENIKPSTVLTISSRFHLLDYWLENCHWICDCFGLDYISLRKGKDSHTIFFYKVSILNKHLTEEENRDYLFKSGYDDTLSNQLKKLKENYKEKFPHEIGVFLGIPPMDVDGFIRNDGKNYLFNGYWKVYYNLMGAVDTFQKFDESRINFMNKIDHTLILH